MEGGSQAQDHEQAIYAKIRYSVSSTFATGCSVSGTLISGINPNLTLGSNEFLNNFDSFKGVKFS